MVEPPIKKNDYRSDINFICHIVCHMVAITTCDKDHG